MDGNQFDALSRSVATTGTRRGIMHLLGALPLLGVLFGADPVRQRRLPG